MLKHKLVDFIIQFMEEVDKEISEMKLFVSPLPALDAVFDADGLYTAERKGSFRCRVFPDPRKLTFHASVISTNER